MSACGMKKRRGGRRVQERGEVGTQEEGLQPLPSGFTPCWGSNPTQLAGIQGTLYSQRAEEEEGGVIPLACLKPRRAKTERGLSLPVDFKSMPVGV